MPRTPAEVDIQHVARALGVALKTVRAATQHPGWRRGWRPDLRVFPRSMSRGYHGGVRQFGCEPQCPAHGFCLETECRSCGSTSAYRIDARVLGAPFRCAQCRRPYARTSTTFAHRRPLPKQARTAITQTFLG